MALCDRLVAAWSEPARHYHTLQHLNECLALASVWGANLAPRDHALLDVALWFHDAVYDPQARDNEARSAQLAVSALQAHGVAPDLAQRVAQLVLATAHATPVAAGNLLTDLLLDIDLAILGACAKRYAQYEAQIRAEYAWADDAAYAAGRAKVLSHFKAMADAGPSALYRTAPGQTRLAQARLNLAMALDGR